MRPSSLLPRDTEWIDSDAALAEVLSVLQGVDEFAIDTEADSYFSYHVKVCLVQLSTRERTFLIDPLAPLDLSPLGEPLADPRVLTCLHAGSNDIALLQHHYGFEFATVFDTMIAAQVLGLEKAGLGALLEERFDVVPDKSLQRSDWRERPLSERQLQYAALDTQHLLALKDQLEDELIDLGRLGEAEEEFDLSTDVRALVERTWDADAFRKVQGSRDLDPKGLRILRELHRMREEMADRADLSPHRILADRLLMELAKRRPRAPHEVRKIRGLSTRREGFIQRVVETVAEAQTMGPVPAKVRKESEAFDAPMSPAAKRLFDALRDWRRKRAEGRGVQEARIGTTSTLRAIARQRPSSHDELAEIPGITNYRCDEYGDEILDLVDAHEEPR